MFDINDFDETLPGPWEWDVKRLAASFEVAGRELGFSAGRPARRSSRPASREYRRADARRPRGCAPSTSGTPTSTSTQLMDWVRAEVSAKRLGKKAGEAGGRGRRQGADPRQHAGVFAKLTHEVDGELRIVADPPLIVPIEDLVRPRHRRATTIEQSMRTAVRVLPPHAGATTTTRSRSSTTSTRRARSSASAASAPARGSSCCVGRDDDDPLFLQAKEAQASVLERFVGESEHTNHGQRVVAGSG